jgi:DNA-binding response OmpR family regulator
VSRILVVDDEVDIRTLVCELLVREGHLALEAGDGEAALRRLGEERLDLVILDVSMPGLDGWEVLERIRGTSEVPVVMLTARADPADRARGLERGAAGYVTKPFRRQELLDRVAAALGE